MLEAAVVPKRDSDGLEKPKAFVVLKSGEPSEALDAELKELVKERDRQVEISALDRVRRGIAEDRDRQDPALQAEGGLSGLVAGATARAFSTSTASGWNAPASARRPATRRRSCCCTRGSAASRCGATFPQKLAAATGFGVFAYSRFGYGASDPVALPRPLDYMTREAVDVLPKVLDAIGFRRGVLARPQRRRDDRGDLRRLGRGFSRARPRADGAAFLHRARRPRLDPRGARGL